jgi:uncharacterized protein (DUF2267 family)
MNYATFVRGVEARAPGGLDQPGAQRAIEVTLHTLAERISAIEAADLAAQLPKQLKLRVIGADVATANHFVLDVLAGASSSWGRSRS